MDFFLGRSQKGQKQKKVSFLYFFYILYYVTITKTKMTTTPEKKQIKKEVAKTLRTLAFGIWSDLKTLKKNNISYGDWVTERNTTAFLELEKQIKIWREITNLTDSKILIAGAVEYNRKRSYCGHYFDFKSNFEHLENLIKKEIEEKNQKLGWEGCRLGNVRYSTFEMEEEFYNGLGYSFGADRVKPENLEKFINIALEKSDWKNEFEKWEQGNNRKTEIKERYQKADNEISVKSFCCSVMATIRDYMLKTGIEDYKNATCELGKARKAAVKSLICYSKTQEAEKVKNFKNLVSSGLYSEKFINWPELKETIKELEKSFVG